MKSMKVKKVKKVKKGKKGKKKKRKMNEFFKLQNAARKKGAKSFVYNGKTYKKAKTSKGLVYYKK